MSVNVMSIIAAARDRNGAANCDTCTSSIAEPPNTIPVTKYGAMVVPMELAVPPIASLWMDWVPFTLHAARYGLITTCRIVADAPTINEPERKTRKPAGNVNPEEPITASG